MTYKAGELMKGIEFSLVTFVGTVMMTAMG
jgi:hypothetical protein